MPRPSIGETPMTGAERQARYRTAHASGAPVIRIRRPAERRSRIQRWNDTIAAAVELQAEYAAWLDALPDNQQDSALADALRQRGAWIGGVNAMGPIPFGVRRCGHSSGVPTPAYG
jgi:hypothetical protein